MGARPLSSVLGRAEERIDALVLVTKQSDIVLKERQGVGLTMKLGLQIGSNDGQSLGSDIVEGPVREPTFDSDRDTLGPSSVASLGIN